MKFLIVGLGSMGKRRVRCLHALGEKEVAAFDLREDRRAEASQKYGIKTFSTMEDAFSEFKPDVLIVSVPPDIHHLYMKFALEHRLPFFVEASVVDTGYEKAIAETTQKKIVGIPSLTLAFHPAIKIIRQLVRSDQLGKISNIIFHSGSYLPEWHTYEHVRDYYVSNPLTGGCREIVPFELGWLTHIFGFPKRIAANVRKTISIEGAEQIDDTYNMLLDFQSFLATVTVDVVSRSANRRLVINGSEKQLYWSWDEHCVKVFHPSKSTWEAISYEKPKAEAGYDPNIGEQMYIDELRTFIETVSGRGEFPNSLKRDHDVLKLLYAAERSEKTAAFVELAQ